MHMSTVFHQDAMALLLASQPVSATNRSLSAPDTHLPEFRDAPYPCGAVLAASVALTLGSNATLTCGGQHGLMWRVEWPAEGIDANAGTGADTNAPVMFVGVLDPYVRQFTTTAPPDQALAGFALAAHGLALAMPQTRFEGAWAVLLATHATEGPEAFTEATLSAIRDAVLEALRCPGMNATEDAEYGDHGFPLWRAVQVDSDLELPSLNEEPRSLARARLHGGASNVAEALAALSPFAVVCQGWTRTVEQFQKVPFVGDQHHTMIMALFGGHHVLAMGPAGSGKTTCSDVVLTALRDRRALQSHLPPMPLARFRTPEALLGQVDEDGDFVDGPLRIALTSEDGAGSVLRLTCDGDVPAALVPVLRAVTSEGELPAGLVPGMPPTLVGENFRLILEVTYPHDAQGLPPNISKLFDGRGNVARVVFPPVTRREAYQLLLDVARLGHARLLYLVGFIVEEVRVAVKRGKLSRPLSRGEVLGWALLAAEMHRQGAAGDLYPVLERAALATWIPSLPDAEDWWRTVRPLALAEGVYRKMVAAETIADNAPEVLVAVHPSTAWYRHEAVRQAIDTLAASVPGDVYLVLRDEPQEQDENGFLNMGWWNGDRMCHVRLETFDDPEDAFAMAVRVAAHERAHALLSPAAESACFPGGLRVPNDEEPEQRRRRDRQVLAYNIIEDQRLERWLDDQDAPRLQKYRRRSAHAETDSLQLTGQPVAQELVSCLKYYISRRIVSGDAARTEMLALLPPGSPTLFYLSIGMTVLGMIEWEPTDVSSVPEAVNLLADILAAAEGASPHAAIPWGAPGSEMEASQAA